MSLIFKQKFNYNHLGIQLKYLHIKLMKKKIRNFMIEFELRTL